MSTPKFSEVFRHAADNLDPTNSSPDKWSTWTCDRIGASFCVLAEKPRLYSSARETSAREILDFYPLADVPHLSAFDEFPRGIERQSARFLWLCMLAEIAESEGN